MQTGKFSIMGDSISTYEGYNPFLYDVFYTEERAALAGLRSADDTWWMQVIHAFGGELCIINRVSYMERREDYAAYMRFPLWQAYFAKADERAERRKQWYKNCIEKLGLKTRPVTG